MNLPLQTGKCYCPPIHYLPRLIAVQGFVRKYTGSLDSTTHTTLDASPAEVGTSEPIRD